MVVAGAALSDSFRAPTGSVGPMKTREKVIEIIDGMSESELEAE